MKKILFVLVLLSASACHKTPPEKEVFLEPVFNLQGSLNGEAIDFTPGIDGRYMFTNRAQLSDGAYRYETAIHGIDGSGPKLEFTLLRSEPGASAEDLLLTLPEQSTNLLIDEEDLVLHSQSDIPNIEWTTQGMTYTGSSVQLPFSFPLSYSFLVADENCFLSANVSFFLPSSCALNGSYEPIRSEMVNDELILTPPTSDLEFAFYTWFIDGNTFVTEQGEPLVYTINGIEPINILLVGIDNMGTEVPIMQQEMPIFFLSESCVFPTISANLGVQGESSLMIEYTDESGTSYMSSDLCNSLFSQGEDAHFDVLNVSAFEINELNQPTKKLEFNVQVELFNSLNPLAEPLILELNNASIAFAF